MRDAFVVLLTLFIALDAGALPAPASPALEPFIQERLKDFLDRWEGRWTIGYSADGKTIDTITGRPRTSVGAPDFDVASMLDFLTPMHGFPKPVFGDPVRRSIAGSEQTIYTQVLEGKTVEGAAVVITHNSAGTLYDIVLNQVPQVAPPPAVRTVASSVTIARSAYLIDIAREAGAQERATILDNATKGDSRPTVTARASEVGPSLIAVGGRIRRVYRITVSAVVPAGRGSATIDSREYAIDATTTSEAPTVAAVVRVLKMMSSANGKARLFDPNPMRTLNDMKVSPDDTASMEKAYRPFPLMDLKANQNGLVFLDGPFVFIAEIEGPDFCPPNSPNMTTPELCLPNVPDSATPDFSGFKRGSPEFAGAMAYFHVDTMQRYVKDRGFSMPRVRVDVADGDNASTVFGQYCDCPVGSSDGFIGLGRKGTLFVAEDATVIAHEYGHALLANGTKGRFLIDRYTEPTSEAGAISEGFADYWALTSFFDQTIKSRFNLDCYGEWANGHDCERHYKDKSSHDLFGDLVDDHINGRIWSGTLLDLFFAIGSDRNISDYVILKGHYLRAMEGAAPTMKNIAEGIVIADHDLNPDHTDSICQVFDKHKIVNVVCCTSKISCSAAPVP